MKAILFYILVFSLYTTNSSYSNENEKNKKTPNAQSIENVTRQKQNIPSNIRSSDRIVSGVSSDSEQTPPCSELFLNRPDIVLKNQIEFTLDELDLSNTSTLLSNKKIKERIIKSLPKLRFTSEKESNKKAIKILLSKFDGEILIRKLLSTENQQRVAYFINEELSEDFFINFIFYVDSGCKVD